MRKFRPFAAVKADLTKQGQSTKYFTKKFYADYRQAYETAEKKIESGTLWDDDEMYEVGNVRLFHCYDKVYDSKFYTKNSCGYCEFLAWCRA